LGQLFVEDEISLLQSGQVIKAKRFITLYYQSLRRITFQPSFNRNCIFF
jgi:hypothetical protein